MTALLHGFFKQKSSSIENLGIFTKSYYHHVKDHKEGSTPNLKLNLLIINVLERLTIIHDNLLETEFNNLTKTGRPVKNYGF